MIPLRDLFESHLTVTNLERSMAFFGDTLGLELSEVFRERRVAFYWVGGRGNSMLGLWEVGTGPQRLSTSPFRWILRICSMLPLVSALLIRFLSTSKGSRPTNRSCLRGCPLHRCTSGILMGTCSSCCQCCPMHPSRNWE